MKCYLFILVALIAGIPINACTPTGLFYVLPDDSTNASCPSYPCASINQYSLIMLNMSNVKFMFLSGKHSLTSSIIMQDVYNVTMVGVNHDSLALAVVVCQSAEALISFVDASNITIINLVFKSCGPTVQCSNKQVDGPIVKALFSMCYCCNITNITLIRPGMVISNLLGESFLHNIAVYSHGAQYSLSEWYHQGIEI